jgi:hypothetical protein
MAFGRGTMGKKCLFLIGPEMGIERGHAFGRADAYDGFPVPLARAFEKPGKNILQALMFEVVKERLAHVS